MKLNINMYRVYRIIEIMFFLLEYRPTIDFDQLAYCGISISRCRDARLFRSNNSVNIDGHHR